MELLRKTNHKSSRSPKNSFFSKVGLIQPKLTIGSPNDKYEQEADHVADQVMKMDKEGIQRKCADCEKEGMAQTKIQRMGMDEEMMQTKPLIQKMGGMDEKSQEENPLMMKSESGGGVATESLSTRLSQSKGQGSPLPVETNSFMSKAIGNDFSNVRVHTGSEAIQMNQGLNARAFTHGNDVYFNKGEYSPRTDGGKKLLAHELTHVVQQGGDNQSTTDFKSKLHPCRNFRY